MTERRVRFCACSITPIKVIENVPAWVYNSCGERIFSDAVTRVFEFIRNRENLVDHVEYVAVFNFDLANVLHQQSEDSTSTNTDSQAIPRTTSLKTPVQLTQV